MHFTRRIAKSVVNTRTRVQATSTATVSCPHPLGIEIIDPITKARLERAVEIFSIARRRRLSRSDAATAETERDVV